MPCHKSQTQQEELFINVENRLDATFQENKTISHHLLIASKRLHCYPHTHFTRVESDNTPDTKELRSLLTLAVSYGAVGTGAAHQYAEPQHQNKLRVPECPTLLCGLLLLYLSQPNTIRRSKSDSKRG